MKQPDKQILSMLQAFKQEDVLKALDLYKEGTEDSFKKTKKELMEEGWFPQEEKPADKESYFFENEYWVQSQEMRDRQVKERIDEIKQNKVAKNKGKKYTGQKMNLKRTEIKCPKCNAGMYKQGVCNGCKEGKKGFKIRLICEENPDHEILL
jgi:hypothetical protein